MILPCSFALLIVKKGLAFARVVVFACLTLAIIQLEKLQCTPWHPHARKVQLHIQALTGGLDL
jgi:hypothetical protein